MDISRTATVLLERTSRLGVDRISYLDLDDVQRMPVWVAPPTAPAGSHWVIPIGSQFPVSAGSGVAYLLQGYDVSEIAIAFPVPRDLRVLKMNMAATTAPTGGNSFTYALRKGNVAGTVFSDTALSVVLSNLEVEDEADGSVDFARGERLCVKLTKTGGVPEAWHLGGLEIELL